jgi:hypothetical protein
MAAKSEVKAVMDKSKQVLVENLQIVAKGVAHNLVHAVFMVAITDDGPSQTVFVEPEDRESLVIAINEELTRMLGRPHHIVSTGKLERFLNLHNITALDLINFNDDGHD